MPLAVAVQMDPLERIKIVGDSTFAMMLQAQARGHTLWAYEPRSLAWASTGALTAKGRAVRVADDAAKPFATGAFERRSVSEFDVVLMRQDPPFDLAYITAAHLLEHVGARTLVVNDPVAVRDLPEKLYVLKFADLMPPTLVSADVEALAAFRAEHRDVVVKPLFGMGGAGVFRITPEDPNFKALLEMFFARSAEPLMIQAFLPEIFEGDRRLILVDGQPKAALNRVPAKGEIRSNLVAGGSGRVEPLTARDREIAARVGPELAARGVVFAGLDVIGGKLTEINVTSPTGLRAIAAQGGGDLTLDIWEAIEARVVQRQAIPA